MEIFKTINPLGENIQNFYTQQFFGRLEKLFHG